jgi:hypothetical protein
VLEGPLTTKITPAALNHCQRRIAVLLLCLQANLIFQAPDHPKNRRAPIVKLDAQVNYKAEQPARWGVTSLSVMYKCFSDNDIYATLSGSRLGRATWALSTACFFSANR